jgi:hypothetical protein
MSGFEESAGDGLGDTRDALRALLHVVAPDERRELALAMGESSLGLARDGETELDRALGMSLTLLSVTSAHVASLESELGRVRADFERYVSDSTDRGIAAVLDRVQALERVCPGVDDCKQEGET